MKRETDRKVLDVFRMLLGLPAPWRMVWIQIREKEKRVEIEVEWPLTAEVPCPECQRRVEIYDYQRNRWWTCEDTMGHTTRLCCRRPRSACPEHGVKAVMVPWVRARADFTLNPEEPLVPPPIVEKHCF